jgi:hypothetical protein
MLRVGLHLPGRKAETASPTWDLSLVELQSLLHQTLEQSLSSVEGTLGSTRDLLPSLFNCIVLVRFHCDVHGGPWFQA